jgi:predicted nucleotidyltransferase
MHNTTKILIDLKNYLRNNYGNSIKDVILFGSRARGDAENDSDFDVLIILDKDYHWKDENKILDLCYDIDLKYNIIIDAHLISQNEINSIRGKQPIFLNAINSGLYA